MSNPMPAETRQFLRRIAGAYVGAYVLLVGSFAALKVWFGADETPWAEVFYGPAITVGSCYLLLVIAIWLECQRRQRI